MSKTWRERRDFLRSEVARLSLFEKESATEYEIAEAIREGELSDGQCGEDTTPMSYLPAARAILAKFDVRRK